MTCIVAYIDQSKETILMGGDSAGVGGYSANSGGYDITTRTDPKIFYKKGYMIGYTSSFRMGQLLMSDLFTPPKIPKKGNLLAFMINEFVPKVRTAMKKGGYMTIKDSSEKSGTFIVTARNKIFTIYDDLQVGEATMSYFAVGCGESYAKGTMWALDNKEDKFAIVLKALTCAEWHSSGVRHPFRIMETTFKGKLLNNNLLD